VPRKEAKSLWVASESTRGVAYSSRLRSLMHLCAAGGVARKLYGGCKLAQRCGEYSQPSSAVSATCSRALDRGCPRACGC
jgi:hypothetical protein